MTNLIKLRDYLNKTGNHTKVDLKTLYGIDHNLGLDEFPHDREFMKELFELNDKDFDFLFIPKDIKITTCGEYVALLSTYIHINGK